MADDDTIYGFDAESVRKIVDTVARLNREARPNNGSSGRRQHVDPVQWLPFRNDFAGTCPANSLLRVTGSISTSVAMGGGGEAIRILTCTQPDTTFGPLYAISANEDVPQNGFGICALSGVVDVTRDTGTPAIGNSYGPKPGYWGAARGYPACCSVLSYDDTGPVPLARVNFSQISHVVGKTIASFGKGTSGTVRLWETFGETVISPTWDLTGVRNRWCDLITGKWVGVNFSGEQAYLVQGDPSNP